MSRRSQQSIVGRMADLKQEHRASYGAMEPSRFRRNRPGVSSMGGSGDAHYANESAFIRMREYCRAMVRDDAITKTLLDRAVTNIVRTGFGYEPDTGDTAVDEQLKARWLDWAGDPQQCDAAGTHTFAEMERLALFQELMDGDIFAIGTPDGAVQLIEADRCRTPSFTRNKKIVHGVELDDLRRRVRYYFTRETVGINASALKLADFLPPVPAYDGEAFAQVWQVFNPHRVTQTRGLPALHAVFDAAGMYEDISFALLVKQQFGSFMVGWIENEGDVQSDAQFGGRETSQQDDGSPKITEQLEPGAIYRARKGQKLTFPSPQLPSTETMQHLRHTLQIIGVNLGLPLCVALMDATETNFSGWRGAVDQAKLGWMVRQKGLEDRLHRNVASFRTRHAIADDPALARLVTSKAGDPKFNVFKHWWQKPSWPYPQPAQDAAAWATKLQTGQCAPRDFHAENGGDFGQFVKDAVADQTLWLNTAADAFVAFTEKYKDQPQIVGQITLRDFYFRDFYRGGQVIDTVETPNDGTSTAAIKDGSASAPSPGQK
jgi:capsid protein